MWQLQNAKQTLKGAVERAVDACRRLLERERDFKPFLREAPDVSRLELQQSAETGRSVEL